MPHSREENLFHETVASRNLATWFWIFRNIHVKKSIIANSQNLRDQSIVIFKNIHGKKNISTHNSSQNLCDSSTMIFMWRKILSHITDSSTVIWKNIHMKKSIFTHRIYVITKPLTWRKLSSLTCNGSQLARIFLCDSFTVIWKNIHM